jgi:transposase
MPEDVLMSEIEIITDGGRRRRWSAAEKLRIVEETLDERESISVLARRTGLAPNLLYRWRRLMLGGGSLAVTGDDEVTRSSLRDGPSGRWRNTSANWSGSWGARTLEGEILKEALDKSRAKNPTLLAQSPLKDGSR